MNEAYYSLEEYGVDVDRYGREEVAEIFELMGLPHPSFKKIDYNSMEKEDVEDFVSPKSFVTVVPRPEDPDLPSEGKYRLTETSEVIDFCESFQQPERYDFLLVEEIKGIPNGYIGSAVSNGEDKIYTEILKEEEIMDTRRLTSTGVDPEKFEKIVVEGEDMYRIDDQGGWVPDRDVIKIYRNINWREGYYEFMKGEISDKRGIYFTEFQDAEPFTKDLDELG